jgi:hypothetical protein
MQLYRLAYGSKVSGRVTKTDLKQILNASIRNNTPVGVSGLLCFTQGYFFQILEGTRYPINRTFQRISQDPRHAEVVLVGLEPIAERAFGSWSMAFVDDSPATTSIVYKHCGADRLFLDYITLKEATALGQELMKPENPAGQLS